MQIRETTQTRFTSRTVAAVTLSEIVGVIRDKFDFPEDASISVLYINSMKISDVEQLDEEVILITWEKMTEKAGPAQERDIDISSQV